jgi:hypothetical protein
LGWQGEIACFFIAVQYRAAFHGLQVKDVTEFDSDCCSIFFLLGEAKKGKEKWLGAFFLWQEAGQALVVFLHWFLSAVRYNYKLH